MTSNRSLQPSRTTPAPDLHGDGVTATTLYTLCSYGQPPKAVAAVGRLDRRSDDAAAHAAYFASAVVDGSVVNERKLMMLGEDPPSPLMVLVPILSRLFLSLDQGHVDVGWTGYVIGSGVVPGVLQVLAPVIGTRHLIDLDAKSLSPQAAVDRAGKVLYLVADADERHLSNLLAIVPDRSLVALLVPVAESSASAINFYETVHRKSLTLIGWETDTAMADRRAVAFLETRSALLETTLPVHREAEAENLEGAHGAGFILDWS